MGHAQFTNQEHIRRVLYIVCCVETKPIDTGNWSEIKLVV
jgi:hypothetical protein